MKKDIKYYELNPSQEVVKLQCKYTLHKRVINIITSMSTNDELDFKLMEKAFNLVVERNDCLRIYFAKHNGKLMQYFRDKVVFENIPVQKFSSQEEFDSFINKIKVKPIEYMKGKVIEPYFIVTHDNKYMVLFKLCHLILDVYGINVIYKDLFEVYDALKNNKELPAAPGSFEEIVKKDLIRKNDKVLYEKHREFFTNLLNNRPEPYYSGLHGSNHKLWQKRLAKKNRTMKMFFIKNDTEGFAHPINSETTKRVMQYCKDTGVSPANFLMYTCNLTTSIMNDKIENILPLELSNCRGTITEKKCAGTKVQSIGCYTTFDYNKSFIDNFKAYCDQQVQIYKHIGFADMDFEMLVHKTYNSSFLGTYYSVTYSFIPFTCPAGTEFRVYSNGKCALPAYIAQLYDVDKNEITMVYDIQTQIMNGQDVEKFHNNYLKVINLVIDNPEISLNDIKL